MRKLISGGYRKMGHPEIIDPEALYEADFQDDTQTCLYLGKEAM
jgi:hypothetical protein